MDILHHNLESPMLARSLLSFDTTIVNIYQLYYSLCTTQKVGTTHKAAHAAKELFLKKIDQLITLCFETKWSCPIETNSLHTDRGYLAYQRLYYHVRNTSIANGLATVCTWFYSLNDPKSLSANSPISIFSCRLFVWKWWNKPMPYVRIRCPLSSQPQPTLVYWKQTKKKKLALNRRPIQGNVKWKSPFSFQPFNKQRIVQKIHFR